MSRDTILACLFSLLTWDVLCLAVRRTILLLAVRRMSLLPPPGAAPPLPLAEERTGQLVEHAFREGWRACERCRRLPTEIDDEHIAHHYVWDGSPKEKTDTCAPC